MAFKFYPLRRWRKQGFSSLLNILLGIAVLYLSASMQDTVSTIIVIISSFLFLKGLYNSVQYFRLPEKDYIRLNDEEIVIHKGNFHKKKISLAKIKKAAEVKGNIVINTGNVYEEEMIYGEWLSDEDVALLKKALSDALQLKAVPFITESARTEDGS